MSERPRDWDKELAAIDKVIEQSPQAPPGRALPPGVPARAPAAAGPVAVGVSPVGRRERMATWLRVGLTVATAAALPFWPYGRDCGAWLFLYLGAVGVVALSALWAAGSSWRRRQGLAHLLALLALGWTLALGAREVLPRVGYARSAATWTCS
jgi:hypothetical protein